MEEQHTDRLPSYFPLLFRNMAFPELSLTNIKERQSQLKSRSQTSKGDGDRRVTDSPHPWSEVMLNAYFP